MGNVSTIVFFHAHPDDEASQTSGTMTLASRRGHRVVVVYGTDGDHGEVPDDLAPGESLVARRRQEAEASALVTGTARLAWLGYEDSGMTGWEQNAGKRSFHTADLDEAAGRLAAILDEEDADVLVTYDWHGGYGHPDHVKAHQVAHRAADLAARRPRVLESTMNRDHLRRVMAMAAEAGLLPADGRGMDVDGPADDGNPFGTPESEIHWAVDISDAVDAKRAALACHASQVTDIGMFLAIPIEHFRTGFGREFYIEPGREAGMVEAWPFD
ncbi:PIG-L deacetylase family protein [Mobilicoccus massiliensis]|uniref:PIG-L deacetylase family protein n=1 Tax=Mobilicoccus massiliensis TaxID=1522310 RepID=UPI000A99819C|nr:PIG-L family deacetylase [Mobilicoccus massiliensis]